jgi:hypothetical protein
MDRERLVKLLNMTDSQHDGEALTAIRRSNALLRQSKTSWAEVLTPLNQPQQVSPPKSEVEPKSAPRQKTAGWGSDLFGDEPTVSPATIGKNNKADDYKTFARARIRSVPIFLRLFFFPIWAFAETYVTTVYRESFGTQVISITVPLLLGGIAGVLWFAIAKIIVKALTI